MAPEGVESDFCLQCWIETLEVQQIFLTFSVEWSKWVDLFLTACWTQACLEGKGTNGTHRSHARCRPDPIPQPVKVGHTTGVYVRNPSNSGVGSFRKSDHLQMSLQRQHFLLSYLKTLSVGQAEVWTGYLPLSRPVLFQLSSPRGGTNSTPWKEPYIPRVFHCLLLFLLEVLWEQLFWNNRKGQFLIIFF